MSYSYFDNLNGSEKTRYKSKLDVSGLTQCPYKEPASKWISDPTQWPEVTYGDIFFYLIESPGPYDRKALKNWRSLDSYKAVMEGWVQEVLHMSTETCQVFTAGVRPSQRMNDTPHRPWAAIDKSGTILTAHCNCMAGLGESCTHVGALLWKVEMAVRLGYTKPAACTDTACAWNADFVKKVKPAEIARVSLYSSAVVSRVGEGKHAPPPMTRPSEAKQLAFINGLNQLEDRPIILSTYLDTCQHWSSLTDPAPSVQRLPLPLTAVYSPEYSLLDRKLLLEKARSLEIAVTTEEVDYLEEVTRGQSKCITWHEQRRGRITSSVAYSVLHTNQHSPAPSLISSICFPLEAGSDADTAKNLKPSIKWGKENEDQARIQFLESGNGHQNLRIENTGLGVSRNHPYLAASPDGLILCECHAPRLLEIKCPYSLRDTAVEDAFAAKNFPLSPDGIKHDHQYYTQIQHQLCVWGMDSCELMIWTPNWSQAVTVIRDEAFISYMVNKFCPFFYNHLLPAMMTGQTKSKGSSSASSDSRKYCTCGEDKDCDLIGCDNHKCPVEWYHIECVNLKKVPRKSWFCSLCKKS